MSKPHGHLYEWFTNDHHRLDRLLSASINQAGEVSVAPFEEFRTGILRHIWQEERLLLPAVQNGQGGVPFEHAARLRLDHGAIAALVVPPPSYQTITAIRHILTQHNPLEEGPGGLYEACESVVGNQLDVLMKEVHAAPEIPTMPFNSDPDIMPAIERAISRAGYDFGLISGQS